MLVDRDGDRDNVNGEQVQGIDQNRPVHLLPLHEEPAALGVLLLNDPDDLKFAGLVDIFDCFVPPGYVFAAACSPGCEDVQQRLLAPEPSDRGGSAVFKRRQNQIGERPADCDRDIARGRNEVGSATGRQHDSTHQTEDSPHIAYAQGTREAGHRGGDRPEARPDVAAARDIEDSRMTKLDRLVK